LVVGGGLGVGAVIKKKTTQDAEDEMENAYLITELNHKEKKKDGIAATTPLRKEDIT